MIIRLVAMLVFVVIAIPRVWSEAAPPVTLSDEQITEVCQDIQKSLQQLELEPEQKLTAAMVSTQLGKYDDVIARSADPTGDVTLTARLMRAQLLQMAGEKDKAEADLKLMTTVKGTAHLIEFAYFNLAKSYSDANQAEDVNKLIAQAEQAKLDEKMIVKLRGLALRATIMPGAVFPDFSFTDLAGAQHTTAEYRGKVLLIDFWATWCPPCRAELPNVKALYDAHHAAGFEIVGVSLDQERAKLDKFLADKELTWTQTCDGKGWDSEIPMHFGIGSIPATFLIDADGKVLGRDIYAKELAAAVEKAIAALPTR